MRWAKSIYILPLLAGALGLFLLYLHNHPDPHYPDRGDRPFREISRATIKRIAINVPLHRDYNPDIMPELEGNAPGALSAKPAEEAKILRKEMVFDYLKDGRLRERDPHDQRSDQEILQPLLDQLLDLAIYERVAYNQEAMGFDPSHVVRVLIETSVKSYRMDFGTISPDGGMIYFKLADSPWAYLTPLGALTRLRLSEEKFLDHTLFSVPPSAIKHFAIETWDSDGTETHLDCMKIQASDEKGMLQWAWKLSDRPIGECDQDKLRQLRLGMMSLRCTNRQWKMQYDLLPPEMQFAIPFPNPLNPHPPEDRAMLSIEHEDSADHEEGRMERYEMVRVEIPPPLYAAMTGIPPEKQNPQNRTFWVARHFATEGEKISPEELEWISFTRSSIDPVLALARQLQSRTGTPKPTSTPGSTPKPTHP